MLEKAKEGLKKAIHHMDVEFSKIQMGRANPLLVEDIMVEQYGALTPLKNVATVSCLDAQTLSIKPWDKNVINDIAKAITNSGKALNPQNMADSVIIKIPPVTEERRKEMTKIVKNISEDSKVAIRNVRGDVMKDIKNAENNKEISEDERKDLEEKVQKEVNEANKSIEEKTKKKNEEVMKV
ncbi:MAG: ribosome recycling factor [Candidatus Gracilibacteria bacterium]|nr:ribosome recycling factor [Candidatus Gracilibacteria bacterium]MDQ7021989.1 ribosome recycling factor [Candidatus Gracilibacteria bacterium]